MASLQAISRFHIASKVPSNGLISYKELAPKAGVDEPMLRRLLRHAMTLRIFREPRPGMVAHTQASKLLARSDVNSFMAYHPEIGWPTAAKVRETCVDGAGQANRNGTTNPCPVLDSGCLGKVAQLGGA